MLFRSVGGASALFNPYGQVIRASISLQPGVSIAAGGVVLHTTSNGVTTDTPMSFDAGSSTWVGTAPAATCGKDVSWSVEAFVSDGTSVKEPGAGAFTTMAATSVTTAVADTCEAATGWVVGATGDNATTGIWINADPVGSAAQPE